MSITTIFSLATKLLAIVKYLPDLFAIGKKIYDIIKNDDEMESPSTTELLQKLKETEPSARATFEEIQKAFAKVKE